MQVTSFAEFVATLLAALTSRYATDPSFTSNGRVMRTAIAHARHDGLWLEFGVFQGNTIHQLAAAHDGVVYGFDSFLGLPETWRVSKRNPGNGFDRAYTMKGSFSLRGRAPRKRRANVEFVKGWFNETLPGFLEQHSAPVRFLHVDCDLYSSSSYVLTTVAPRLQNGTVVLFDELINYPGFEKHEMRALWEYLAANAFDVRVLSGARARRSPMGEFWPQSAALQLVTRAPGAPVSVLA